MVNFYSQLIVNKDNKVGLHLDHVYRAEGFVTGFLASSLWLMAELQVSYYSACVRSYCKKPMFECIKHRTWSCTVCETRGQWPYRRAGHNGDFPQMSIFTLDLNFLTSITLILNMVYNGHREMG